MSLVDIFSAAAEQIIHVWNERLEVVDLFIIDYYKILHMH